MMRTQHLMTLAVVLGLGAASEAMAQPPVAPVSPYGGGVTPPFSPYLNLLRHNNPAYLNYYGLVRPEVEFRGAVRALQQQQALNQQAIQDQGSLTGLPITGHRTTFLNTGGYFLNGTGSMSRRIGTAPIGGAGAPAVATPSIPTPGAVGGYGGFGGRR